MPGPVPNPEELRKLLEALEESATEVQATVYRLEAEFRRARTGIEYAASSERAAQPAAEQIAKAEAALKDLEVSMREVEAISLDTEAAVQEVLRYKDDLVVHRLGETSGEWYEMPREMAEYRQAGDYVLRVEIVPGGYRWEEGFRTPIGVEWHYSGPKGPPASTMDAAKDGAEGAMRTEIERGWPPPPGGELPVMPVPGGPVGPPAPRVEILRGESVRPPPRRGWSLAPGVRGGVPTDLDVIVAGVQYKLRVEFQPGARAGVRWKAWRTGPRGDEFLGEGSAGSMEQGYRRAENRVGLRPGEVEAAAAEQRRIPGFPGFK